MMSQVKRFLTLLVAVVLLAGLCAPVALAADSPTIEVSLMIIGDSHHGPNQHAEYQIWMDRTYFQLQEGSTLADLIKAAGKASGIEFDIQYAGTYIAGVKAPAILGGYWLKERDNAAGAGWHTSYATAGTTQQVFYSTGITGAKLSAGDFAVLHYADDWQTTNGPAGWPYAREDWLDAAPLPEDTAGRGSTGGSGGSGSGDMPSAALPKEYTAANLQTVTKNQRYRLTVEAGSTIKAETFASIPAGAVFYADTTADNAVQFRLQFANPAQISSDIQPAMAMEGTAGTVTEHFAAYFTNPLKVLRFDHSGSWGQSAQIMANTDQLETLETASLVLYTFDRAQNSYRQIEHWVDANGYVRFTVDDANPIVFSQGALQRK